MRGIYAEDKHTGPNAALREHLRRDHRIDDEELRGPIGGYKHGVTLERMHRRLGPCSWSESGRGA